MARKLKIDFVSDVVCPWCAVGLGALDEALRRLDGEVQADIHFQPFELNPQLAPEGEDVGEHLARKYGSTPEQMKQNQEAIRQRGADVGFTFNLDRRQRIYNTFDAHRLLYWAGTEGGGRQQALEHALFEAYFSEQRDPSDHAVLVEAAARAGLDRATAADILASDRYAAEVREAEHLWQRRGVNSVPAVIVNERWLISGGQPADAFEQTLRSIAKELAPA